ncbi:hypothetical protein ARHIZOSPH14_19640 [Agromyces rhizosphaerae]|uniref:Uncharacterized protein n=1 Tax=Agromyces rhizosphaerae TaxID=88374 RepID=A0A9W6FRJ2_9MICO|nr:hypothetical protein [Agromyces rhizosphaerae]GLI27722.1 hypothetical protein ARHIZOSPH14_19640 [Agromyces rhizosphaerae]
MTAPTRTIVVEPARSRFPDDSIESGMLRALGAQLRQELTPASITVDEQTRFEVEGAARDGSVFVQLVGNTGEFKSAHRNRVTANLFKLAWVKQALFPEARLALCITPTVAKAFVPNGWTTVATRDLGVEVLLYDVDSQTLSTLHDGDTSASPGTTPAHRP